MTAALVRLLSLVRKELLAIFGDKQSLRLLIMPVILQVLLFPFAATLEVKNNTLAFVDEDGGAVTDEILQRLTHTPAFTRVVRLRSEGEARELIDRQEALLVLRFAPRFSAAARAGAPAPIQVLLDGRRSNSDQIALSYVQSVVAGVPTNASGAVHAGGGGLAVRTWYNPNLEYLRFILPSLVAIITTLSALIVTAMSVAREREQGTLEQLLVSPLTPSLIFLGKAAPAFFAAGLQATIILAAGVFGYGIAFQGSLLLLYGCMFTYVFALVGVGLFISSFCSTQQQAFLATFLFMMPAILLSGFVTPIDNMPQALQLGTWANPLRHFVFVAKSVYLKRAVFGDCAQSVIALLAIGTVTSAAALTVFRRRLS
jgi:ABC-2 type transport system permease protein